MASMLRSAIARKNLPEVPYWLVGVALATPAAALLQGTLMLSEYRRHHGDAPHPINPSRGIVVLKGSSGDGWNHPPIRLLVIGDSLAAGVGMSKQGTPILPESIAKSISQASGGRAVSWTCVGTPGASAGRIVLDIVKLGSVEPNLLEKQFIEWRATKRQAQTWLKSRKQRTRQDLATTNKIKRWWIRLKLDMKDFRTHVLRRGTIKDAVISELMEERRLLKGKHVVDAAEFDIAVVITGLNDLKDIFLPFMMQGDHARDPKSKENTSNDGLKGELLRVLEALRTRMNLPLPANRKTQRAMAKEPDEKEEEEQHRRPMVVFPALPTSPMPLVHRAPLAWFVTPLIEMIDHQKKLLADQFPDTVLFVDSPSAEIFRQVEAGQGPLIANRKAEQVLLAITDVTQRAKEQVEQLMRQHYQRWTKDAEEEADEEEAPDKDRDAFGHSYHDHLPPAGKRAGSTLVAPDNIHPNDEGYDIWGKYIAAAIINELNKNGEWGLTS